MLPAATKSEYDKNHYVLLFFTEPNHKGHLMHVKCEQTLDELMSKFGYYNISI